MYFFMGRNNSFPTWRQR